MLIFKLILAFTNYSILLYLVHLIYVHYKNNYNINSFSNLYHILSLVWLTIRGLFWTLTLVTSVEWSPLTFYILYWMPSPFQFSSFMLLPLFCAQILYPTIWKEYGDKIRFVYIGIIIIIVLFQTLWSILAAYETKNKSRYCGGGIQDNHDNPYCLHTDYSSDAFRAVTASCFISLAIIQGLYGLKFKELDKKTHERFLTTSPQYLLYVNIVLFTSFLSKGLYQIGAIFHKYILPDIALQNDEDITFSTFLCFELWEYLPTILLILSITGKAYSSIKSSSIQLVRRPRSNSKSKTSNENSNNKAILLSTSTEEYNIYGSIYKQLGDNDDEEIISSSVGSVDSKHGNNSFKSNSFMPSSYQRDSILERFEAPSSLIPTYTWLNGPGSIFDEPNTYLRGGMTPTESPHFEEKSLLMQYRKFKEREGSIGSINEAGLPDLNANVSENGRRSLGRSSSNTNRPQLPSSNQTWSMSPPKSSLMKVSSSPLRGKNVSPNRSKSISIDTSDNYYHDANHPISNSFNNIINDDIESRKSSSEPLIDNDDTINKGFGNNLSNQDVITAVPKPSRLLQVQLSTSLNHSSSNSNSISPSEFTPTINTPDRMEAAVAAATQRLNNPNKNSIVRRNAELITYENSV